MTETCREEGEISTHTFQYSERKRDEMRFRARERECERLNIVKTDLRERLCNIMLMTRGSRRLRTELSRSVILCILMRRVLPPDSSLFFFSSGEEASTVRLNSLYFIVIIVPNKIYDICI